MATIQKKTSRGRQYWYLVESRRVNGKPRPVVLAYLGKAEDLLARLQGMKAAVQVKSCSHGGVAALLAVAQKLEVPHLINKHIESPRPYMAKKPVRNNLTAGMTMLLGAIGRVCMPTSKRGWWNWARTTSCEYLLRVSLSRVDSQHFWDLMDALPVAAIEKIEDELLRRVKKEYSLESETLFFDTSNFFTYIATTNDRCNLAQRGKNKQKRHDLRQVGLALAVTRKDFIPLFHLTYQGNRNDSKVFSQVLASIKKRMQDLELDLENHTLVFDRGNNTKKNMALVAELKVHYVGALTPYHHRPLLAEIAGRFQPALVGGESLEVYRGQHTIWGEKRTVLVFVSKRLKSGQLRGIYHSLAQKEEQLKKIQQTLARRPKPRDKGQLENQISELVKGQFIAGVIEWALQENSAGQQELEFSINHSKLAAREDDLGFRILMTDRHDWDTVAIINAYHGQSTIERAFKNLKNPYHLALTPQFHWTDQKIIVHDFMCVLGYLLTTLVWREAREKARFKGTLDNLLDGLGNIRLAAIIEQPQGQGRPKANYQLEAMSKEENALVQALDIAQLHRKQLKFKGVGVYK